MLLERTRQETGEISWRNGYRSRSLSVAGIGRLVVRVPRDRRGRYRSELLPFRKRRTIELEELAAEMFLAGLSTRDVARVLERHFGDRFDSNEMSRMVAATSAQLDRWRRRRLDGEKYRVLFVDGTNFKVRRGGIVETIPALVGVVSFGRRGDRAGSGQPRSVLRVGGGLLAESSHDKSDREGEQGA